MLTSIVFASEFWTALNFLPLPLAFLAGAILWSGLFGLRGWEPRCRRCGHDLRKSLEAAVCAECGADLTPRGAVRAGRVRVRPFRTLTGVLLVAVTIAFVPPSLQLTTRLREALASRLSVPEIIEGSKGASHSWFARQLLADRVNIGNDESKRSAVVEVIAVATESLRSGSQVPSLVWEIVHEAARNNAVTAEQHAAIADSVIASMRSGKTTIMKSSEIIQLVMSNRDLYGARLAACPECLVATVTLTPATQSPIPDRDLSIVAAYDMSLFSLVGSQARLTIDKVHVKREGSGDWIEAELEDDPFRGMDQGSSIMCTIKRSAFQAPGSYAIRAEGSLRLPGATLKPIALERETAVTVVDPATIVLTPLRDDDAKAAVEVIVRAVRLRPERAGRGWSVWIAQKPATRNAVPNDARIVADVTVVQGEHRRMIGQLMLWARGSSQFDGGASSDANSFDEAQPFELRFDTVPRDRIPATGEAFSYVDRGFTLRFENIDDLDPEIVWPDVAADAD